MKVNCQLEHEKRANYQEINSQPFSDSTKKTCKLSGNKVVNCRLRSRKTRKLSRNKLSIVVYDHEKHVNCRQINCQLSFESTEHMQIVEK